MISKAIRKYVRNFSTGYEPSTGWVQTVHGFGSKRRCMGTKRLGYKTSANRSLLLRD